MVGRHHQLNAHEFEQALGAGDGQGGLACCSPWGHKKSDSTEQLNNDMTASVLQCAGRGNPPRKPTLQKEKPALPRHYSDHLSRAPVHPSVRAPCVSTNQALQTGGSHHANPPSPSPDDQTSEVSVSEG